MLDRSTHLSCRRCLQLGAALGATSWFVTAAPVAWSDRKASLNEKSPAELLNENTWAAIDKAHQYLVRKQIRDGKLRGAFGNSGYAAGVATTSLAGLSFMAGGSVPGDGKYGSNVDLCAEYVLNNVQDSGYIALSDNSVHENMYGHGFSMLFLSQVLGEEGLLDRREELVKVLTKSVEFS